MASATFDDSLKILIIVGAVDEDCKVTPILTAVKSGLLKWSERLDNDLVSSLNQCLGVFSDECKVLGHSESLAPYTKLTCIRDNVSLLVLVSPTCVMVNNGIAELMLSPCSKRLIVYGGHFVDSQPNWVFQDGVYAIEDLDYLLIDKEITSTLVRTNMHSKITVSCCDASKWKVINRETPQVEIEFIDPFLPSSDETPSSAALEHVDKFIDFLEDALKKQVQGIFSQLSPPKHKIFHRTQRPSIYIFPSGNGDSAFFKVDCFSVLVNGGALTRPWFWHLVRHEYRVDCMIATHLSADNLSGLNSFLLRKLHEQKMKFPKDQECEEFQYLSKFLLSPDLGTLFINQPTKFLESALRKGSETNSAELVEGGNSSVSQQLDIKTGDVVRETFRLLKSLQLDVKPLTRKGTPEPITLLYKLGIGKLQLYPISPDEDSKELEYLRQKWGNSIKATGKSGVKLPSGEEGHSLVSDLASMCCLLVWFPASPKERIVRLLFPGNAPESRIFEGLEKLKQCKFLQSAHPTGQTIESNRSPTTKSSRVLSAFKSKPPVTTKPVRNAASAKNASTPSSKTAAGTKSTAAASKQSAANVKSAPSSKSTPPLLSKVAAVNQKKAAFPGSKKPVTAKIDSAKGDKRDVDTKKTNDKRQKVDKSTTSSKAQPTKPKSSATSTKSDPMPKAKKVAVEKSAKSPPNSKQIGNKRRLSSGGTISARTKKPASVASKFPNKNKTNSAKKPAKAVVKSAGTIGEVKKTEEALNSDENISDLLEKLTLQKSVDGEGTEHLKTRPSPEGQDHAEQETFVESVADEIVDSPKLKEAEKKKATKPATDSSSDYLTVSPKTNQDGVNPVVVDEKLIAQVDLEEITIESEKETITKDGDGDAMMQKDEAHTVSTPINDNSTCDIAFQSDDEVIKHEEKSEDHYQISDPCPVSESSLTKVDVEHDNKVTMDADSINEDKINYNLNAAFNEAQQSSLNESRKEEQPCLSEKESESVTDEKEPEDKKDDDVVRNVKENSNETEPIAVADSIADLENKDIDEVQILMNSNDLQPALITSESSQSLKSDDTLSTGQKYMEIENSSSTKDPEMSCTPLSGGSPLPTKMNEEDFSLEPSSGIVEFHHVDNNEERFKDTSNIAYVDDEETIQDKDAIVTDHDHPTILHHDKTSCDNDHLETKDVSSDQLDNVYDDNGNRTAPAYSTEFMADESRTDAILNWPQAPPVYDEINDDICDDNMSPVTSHHDPSRHNSMIVSFQNDESLFEKDRQEMSLEQFHEEAVKFQKETVNGSLTDLAGEVCSGTVGEVSVKMSEECLVHASDAQDNFTDPSENVCGSLNEEDVCLDRKASADLHEKNPIDAPEEAINHFEEANVDAPGDFVKSVQEIQADDEVVDVFKKSLLDTPTEETFDDVSKEVHVDTSTRGALDDSNEEVASAEKSSAAILEDTRAGEDQENVFTPSQMFVASSCEENKHDFSNIVAYDHSTPDVVNTKKVDEAVIDPSDPGNVSEIRNQSSQFQLDESNCGSVTASSNQKSSGEELDAARSCGDAVLSPGSYNQLPDDASAMLLKLATEGFHEKLSIPVQLSYHDHAEDDNDHKHDQKDDITLINDTPDDFGDVINCSFNTSKNVAFETKVNDTIDDVKEYTIESNNYRLVHENRPEPKIGDEVSSPKKDSGIASAINEFDNDLGQLHADQTATKKNEETSFVPCDILLDSPLEKSVLEKHLTEPTEAETLNLMKEDCLKSSGFADHDIFDTKVVEAERDVIGRSIDESSQSKNASISMADAPVYLNPNNPFIADMLSSTSYDGSCPTPKREEDPSMAPERSASSKARKPTALTNENKKEQAVFHVDLAYVPHHANKNHCGVEFFKRIRAHYYVLSGFDASNHEPSSETLEAMLEGKKTWEKSADPDESNVSVIPTHNSTALFNWFEKNHKDLNAEGIHLVAIGSKVHMLSEEIEACKIEF